MTQINECIIDYYKRVDNKKYYNDINNLPNNITHIRIYYTDYVEAIYNLPSTVKYFSREYDESGHCFEGFGKLEQIDNFPYGLEVLMLYIEKFNSFLNLPPSLEFIVILNKFYSYEEIHEIKASNIKPKIIIPLNIKTFITTNFINDLYDIHIENLNTNIIIVDKQIINSIYEIISKNMPKKYKEYYLQNKFPKTDYDY